MEKYDWENMSNSKIRGILEGMKNEYESLGKKVSSILEEMKKIEKEYLLGNNILVKRKKGE
jgi:uncharacterized protein YeeX (DUF496 family)